MQAMWVTIDSRSIQIQILWAIWISSDSGGIQC